MAVEVGIICRFDKPYERTEFENESRQKKQFLIESQLRENYFTHFNACDPPYY